MRDFAKIIKSEDGRQIVVLRKSCDDHGEHVEIHFRLRCQASVCAEIGWGDDVGRADEMFDRASEWVPSEVHRFLNNFDDLEVQPAD